jgi:hypothetical protein
VLLLDHNPSHRCLHRNSQTGRAAHHDTFNDCLPANGKFPVQAHHPFKKKQSGQLCLFFGFNSVFLVESFHPTAAVNDPLFACEKRMTL